MRGYASRPLSMAEYRSGRHGSAFMGIRRYAANDRRRTVEGAEMPWRLVLNGFHKASGDRLSQPLPDRNYGCLRRQGNWGSLSSSTGGAALAVR